MFSPFGEVTSHQIMKKRHSMGYGFVTYSSLDDAVIATSVMNEKARPIEQHVNPDLWCKTGLLNM